MFIDWSMGWTYNIAVLVANIAAVGLFVIAFLIFGDLIRSKFRKKQNKPEK